MSVCGTGAAWIKLSGFSREFDYLHYQTLPKKTPYFQVQLNGWICLPMSTSTLFNAHIRRCAEVSLLRLHIAPCGSNGILTVSSIGLAVRLILRARLTPGRLTLPGNPWSFGERASNPLYRYLYLHLLFHKLQPKSSSTFNAGGMLPYRCHMTSRGFGYRFHTRLLSMRRPSTSELLRTL